MVGSTSGSGRAATLGRATRLGYLGPPGTFSEEAVRCAPDADGAELVALPTVRDTIMAVHDGDVERAVVPIENSLEGPIGVTLDTLAEDKDVTIVGELVIAVSPCLIVRGDEVTLEMVQRVVSHPQPLAQCRGYLAKHFPGVALDAAASTATAAASAAKNPSLAAIASRLAAQIHGLEPVASSIQDNPANVTRFLVLSDLSPDSPLHRSGEDRTSLVVSVHVEVGVLGKVLHPFTANRVNLSMIESRPILGRPWEYRFFLDVTGHVEDKPLARTLAQVAKVATSTKVLGSYPVAR